ncbi:MAG: YbhB/YbcL family Raf kinase inhibitor-like protein [Spirochaetes bacterium]|nr:YbhB/YbcL family Raf kinase inhibitor-like protein [Spirochaetota bacterium]
MKLLSKSYSHNEKMNIKHSTKAAGGSNISPELHWENPPTGTKSFVLAMVDHHPVASNWVHWIIINIPANVNNLPENISNSKNLPKGSIELINTFGSIGYGGPQPPRGTGAHHYDTTLYALNVENVSLSGRVPENVLLKQINNYILEKSLLTGLYER